MRRIPSRGEGRGVALVMAFSITMVILALVAGLYWITAQRHTLMRKRAQRSRMVYLAESGMVDAMARLRTGVIDRGIASSTSYCLNPETGAGPTPCAAPSPALPVQVVVSPINANGVNPISVTVQEY